ncbi:MAG: hypothetical protein EBS04_02825, partial [Chitinophagia bacterium]|nr:hypothetical protein [Chitinophagia bacterium]
WRGEDKDFQYLIDRWKEQGIYDDILNGTIHIIWTGGEPTIKGHQEAITNFLDYWINYHLNDASNPFKSSLFDCYNEIETNGTVVIEDDLFNIIDQINCSPKLSNSGMTEKQRINPEAIKRIMEHNNYQFKFVISNEDDVKEMFRDFIVPFNIPLKNVVCMPGLDDVNNFEERTQFEAIRKATPEIDQMVIEHAMFLREMDIYVNRKNFSKLNKQVFNQLFEAGTWAPEAAQTTLSRVIQLWTKYKKVTAIAASVGGFIALFTSAMMLFFFPSINGSKNKGTRER